MNKSQPRKYPENALF